MGRFTDNTSSAPRLLLLGVVALSFALMLWASFGDSAIMDELAHIPAGYGYVANLDYRLNPEHPPLVKALAAAPLAFLGLYFPINDSAWTKDINGQWAMGSDFLYGSGNDADYIVRSARIGPMILTLLLIVLIYAWSAKLFGEWWALLPSALFGLSPTVLAHGHYVTTDVGAALGIVLSSYYFIKFIFSPSLLHLFAAGIAFGIAQLMKFSAVLLIPYFIILLIFYFVFTVLRDWEEIGVGTRLKRLSLRVWHYLRSLVIVFVIGYIVVVYPAYFLFTLNYPSEKQVADTEFTLNSFASGPTPPGQICKPARCLADLNIWMTKNQITRPLGEYLLGVLMVMQRSAGGNTSYFLGEVSAAGSKLYFPVVYFLKETLPTIAIVLVGVLLALFAIFKKFRNGFAAATKYFLKDYLGTRFAEFSMFVFVVFYWVYSMKSPLNIGVRHLLPTFPFIYMLAASSWKNWLASAKKGQTHLNWKAVFLSLKKKSAASLKYSLLGILIIWFAAETALSAPYFLSYFNELGGGISGGYRYVTDSNYDWGQDLLRLKDFVESRPEIEKIAVDYFGGGNPKYALGAKEVDWWSSRGNPSAKGIHWLAVSVNTLQGAIQPLAPGQNRNPEDEYRWLTSLRPPQAGMGNLPQPDYRTGTSIFIYKL